MKKSYHKIKNYCMKDPNPGEKEEIYKTFDEVKKIFKTADTYK